MSLNSRPVQMIDHKPQLDALRAFAVLLVIVHHSWSNMLVGLGHQGVQLFFVLSGFLITSILLDCKSQIEQAPDLSSRSFMLRQFYARRFLRIFPAYYALLLVIGLFALTRPTESAWVQSIKFHASYTSNFWFALNGNWSPVATGHFWSLAVEEQFYLFWPLLMLWLPRKHLWAAVVLLVISGPIFRGSMLAYGTNDLAGAIITPACFDALGLGALLALVRKMPRAQAIIRLLGLVSLVVLTGISFAFVILDSALWIEYVQVVLIKTLWAVAFMALVSKAAEGFTGSVGTFLTLSSLRYLGRISYGLYLYHMPILFLVRIAFDKLGLSSFRDGPICLAVAGSITMVVAALSWRYFEEPINRLKCLFPYQAPRRAVVVSGPIAAAAPMS
jgi:peptidoglycan/LPS O-acetylase OafA/YrhL